MASWKGFRGSHSRGSRAGSECEEGSHYSPHAAAAAADDAFTAAVATVVRAPPKDFRLVREEWAATRIQTAFRAFLV